MCSFLGSQEENMSKVRNRCVVAALAALFPIAAFADISGTATLNAGGNYNLDTGANVPTGGDISFSATGLAFVGSAKGGSLAALGLSGASAYASVSQIELTALAAFATSTAIPLASLPVNTILGVATNGGNASKLLITASSASSVTFQYTTYESAAPNTPTITGIQNNYSLLVPGLPNYGISPGTLFIIRGTNLASVPVSSISALQSSAAPGIPSTLNGAQITVTVGSFTAHPGMYYAGATQIAAVLPSGTPAGTGTVTVSYGGATSNAASITVVASALGLDTYYGSGSGLGVATDAVTGALITYTNSAKPGESLVLWGSGLGADTADSDTTFTTSPHAVNVPITVYMGGVAVTPGYAGSSGYPGLNQINVTVPSNVPFGCGVSVVAETGSGAAANVSNTMAIPISQAGGVCTDSALGYNGTTLTTTTTQSGTYNFGSLGIVQTTTPVVGSSGGLQTSASGIFEQVTYSASTTSGSVTSLGSCAVSGSSTTTTGTIPTIVGLDAGTLTITGPTGTQPLPNESIPTLTGPSGLYIGSVGNSFFPPTGGTFTFTGTGGKDIGAFTASIAYTNPLVWTNMNSIKTVTRASGQPVTWSGGAPNSYVFISGSSASNAASASFTCYAPASAGQFTVPSYVLLALPAGPNGDLLIENAVASTFSASGLTSGFGSVVSGVSFSISPAYN
jgi:uncharacterized protein (TIGR03437 family)